MRPLIILLSFLSLVSINLRAQIAAPIISSVSVNTLDQATISWNTNSDPLVIGYIIYKVSGGQNLVIDTVFGHNTTTYTNTLTAPGIASEAGIKSENYRVAASYLNGINDSPFSLEHRTIFMQYELDSCSGDLSVEWNSYQNWPFGVDKYELVLVENGATTMRININKSDTTYFFQGLNALSDYNISILASNSNGDQSVSNAKIFTANFIALPNIVYLSGIKVIDETTAELKWYTNFVANTLTHEIRHFKDGVFQSSKTISTTGDSVYRYVFDGLSILEEVINEFEIRITNSCQLSDKISNRFAVVRLEITEIGNSTMVDLNANLVLSDRQVLNSTFDLYQIDFNGLFYKESASIAQFNNFDANGCKACFYLVALSENLNQFGETDTSISNQVCVNNCEKYPVNGFLPGSDKYPIFNPASFYKDTYQTQLRIYNRFGQEIFFSDNSEIGWDGNIQNSANPAIQGVYVYQLNLENKFSGETSSLGGTVSLFR
jgi:hypothetical protein